MSDAEYCDKSRGDAVRPRLAGGARTAGQLRVHAASVDVDWEAQRVQQSAAGSSLIQSDTIGRRQRRQQSGDSGAVTQSGRTGRRSAKRSQDSPAMNRRTRPDRRPTGPPVVAVGSSGVPTNRPAGPVPRAQPLAGTPPPTSNRCRQRRHASRPQGWATGASVSWRRSRSHLRYDAGPDRSADREPGAGSHGTGDERGGEHRGGPHDAAMNEPTGADDEREAEDDSRQTPWAVAATAGGAGARRWSHHRRGRARSRSRGDRRERRQQRVVDQRECRARSASAAAPMISSRSVPARAGSHG